MNTKVLNIDDDPIALFLVSNALKSAGFEGELLDFANGGELKNFLKDESKDGENYLLLLDINMPEVSGWDICNQIKNSEYKGQYQVVIITSSIDRADREKSLDYPFIKGFVTKPVSADNLKPFIG